MSGSEVRSYYGQPILKAPEWTWEVPWYFFAGGLAGASSVLSLAARLTRRRSLAAVTRAVAAAAAIASPVLLISDLGRPKRFLHMLRVFKPTSAMSVGSWVLASYGAAATGAMALTVLGRFPGLRTLLDVAAAALGVPMTTYTAVLVADTSIPVWHEARRELPFVFAGSAAASAGAVASVLAEGDDAGPARRLAVGGVVMELAADAAMRRRLGFVGEVYDQGDTARWHHAAQVSSALGAALVATGGSRRRGLAAAGAGLIVAGSVCQRWAVYRAGFASAADPAYVVAPQRQRLGA
jgi:formate-dependent nitrite reductase membrane component NrfD